MKIDLSVVITEEILESILKRGSNKQIPPVAQFGHIGTHFDIMDKTFHLDNTERTGKLFDVSYLKNRAVEINDIDATRIHELDFVMFYTGCLKERGYGKPDYFVNHPELSEELIAFLVGKKVSLIGIDAPGIRKPAEHPKADQYCADHGIFVIENLANLDVLAEKASSTDFLVHTYPVNYEGLSGLPCRIIAEI
ncbi:cyclase family protein [Anaerospora sp.]|uniref:cyclase family protein n=1 Tax=Anaerospora sp. TaxID=1960278 RepID=UPI0028A07AFF|nr:cyclase family protein [Anaerospora sp.]